MVVNSKGQPLPPPKDDLKKNSGFSEFIWSGDVFNVFLFWVHFLWDSKKKVPCQSYSLWGILFLGGGVWSHYTPENQKMSSKKGPFHKEIKFNKALLRETSGYGLISGGGTLGGG